MRPGDIETVQRLALRHQEKPRRDPHMTDEEAWAAIAYIHWSLRVLLDLGILRTAEGEPGQEAHARASGPALPGDSEARDCRERPSNAGTDL